MKKQIVAIALLLVLSLTLFSGCTSQESDTLQSKLIGTWALEYVIIDGAKEYSSELTTYTFYEDGSCSHSFLGDRDGMKWMFDVEEDVLIYSFGGRPRYKKILKLTSSELMMEDISFEENRQYMFTRR